ncbi:MAG: Rieske 2Fe-2S domain-containing protein [Mucilaginibacter sp.]
MERDEFLSKLSLGVLLACTGCGLVSCSKKGDPSPANSNTPTPGSGTVFTADLSTTLLNIGDTKVANGVILARIAAGNTAASFTAVQVACTHEGTAINYNQNQGIFICPLHGSEFSTTGQVIMGPAAAALQRFTVSVNGSIATVTA